MKTALWRGGRGGGVGPVPGAGAEKAPHIEIIVNFVGLP